MNAYILSILGIVVAGVIIDIIIPSGNINKYIKSIYSIFVVAVLIMPVINLINNKNEFVINYKNYELQEDLISYMYKRQTDALEQDIEEYLSAEGFKNIDINLNFSIENNELIYKTCNVNLKDLAINADKQHINKYEFIYSVVEDYTNLTSQEIIIDEW